MQEDDGRHADIYNKTTRLKEASLIRYHEVTDDCKEDTIASNLEVTELNNTNTLLTQTQELDEANAVFSSSSSDESDEEAKSMVTISPRKSAMYL